MATAPGGSPWAQRGLLVRAGLLRPCPARHHPGFRPGPGPGPGRPPRPRLHPGSGPGPGRRVPGRGRAGPPPAERTAAPSDAWSADKHNMMRRSVAMETTQPHRSGWGPSPWRPADPTGRLNEITPCGITAHTHTRVYSH